MTARKSAAGRSTIYQEAADSGREGGREGGRASVCHDVTFSAQ
jgi:hypothetical protein